METRKLKKLLSGTGMRLGPTSYVDRDRLREFSRFVLAVDYEDCADKAYRYLFTCRVEPGDFVERILTGPGLRDGIQVDSPPIPVALVDYEAGTFSVLNGTEEVGQLRMIDMGITWRRP